MVSFGQETSVGLSKSLYLKQILSQLNNDLKFASAPQRAAYLAHSIMILKPFSSLNNKVALLSSTSQFAIESRAQPTASQVEQLGKALSNNSYLDNFITIFRQR